MPPPVLLWMPPPLPPQKMKIFEATGGFASKTLKVHVQKHKLLYHRTSYMNFVLTWTLHLFRRQILYFYDFGVRGTP